jgi:PKHD-type hydroxylase
MTYGNITNNRPLNRVFKLHPYVYWDGVFDDSELQKLKTFLENSEPLKKAEVLNEEQYGSHRKSKVAFHNFNADTEWIFLKFNSIIEHVNRQFFNFDLNGYDIFQYGEYHASENGKYDYHTDSNFGDIKWDDLSLVEPRKLSLTMLLNEPNKDFTGGEFSFNVGREDNPLYVELKEGRIILFPSFLLHRVHEVKSGIRKSLVIWVTGPKFK